jgi:Tfp pilus assembly protein PilX
MNGNPLRPQAGMVLLFCLMFLTALTLLGLSASSDSIMQHQLSANMQQTEHAKQAARATLAWAEHWLTDLPGPPPESCQTSNQTACVGFSVHASGSLSEHPEFETLAWWQTHGFVAGTDPHTGEHLETVTSFGIDPPLWIIESIHETPPTENTSNRLQVWYRLLARGSGQRSGQTGTTVSVIESIVRKDWPGIDETDQQTTKRVAWQELR